MSNANKILDRIQKLLRLANNAGSEAEAALAATRARAMMAEHEIHEAQVSLETPAEPRVVEPIERRFEVTKTKKKVAWHMRLANGVARSYGARTYWMGGRIQMFGRLSAVQAANYTLHFLIREVERITDKEAPTSLGKSYRNAFRLGCASRIEERLGQLTRDAAKAPQAPPSPEFSGEGWDAEDVAAAVEASPVNPMALAIVETDKKEVEDAYDNFSKSFGRAPHVGNISSGGGYHAGKAAGNRANLGGNARGGLKAGQGTLK